MGERMGKSGDQPKDYSLARITDQDDALDCVRHCNPDHDHNQPKNIFLSKGASSSISWPSSPACSKASSSSSSTPASLTPRFSGMSLGDVTKVTVMQEMDKLKMTNDKALDLSLPTRKSQNEKR